MTTKKKTEEKNDNRHPCQINLTELEKATLSAAADTAGLPLATFIRVKALEAVRGGST